MYSLDEVRAVDPEVAEAITDEMARQNSHIELIASENWVSKALRVCGRGGGSGYCTGERGLWL